MIKISIVTVTLNNFKTIEKTIKSILSNTEEKELVAKKIFEKHNLNVDEEEHSNNLRISRSESFDLNNEFNNEFNKDEHELIDIIPHEQRNDDADIKNIIHDVVEKVEQVEEEEDEDEEEENEYDDDKDTINSQAEGTELTAKQKKNAKKRQKKKEKAKKEKEENELLDKMKEENGNYIF